MKINQANVEMYYQPLNPTDINLAELVAEHIKTGANEVESELFLNSKDIQSVYKLNQVSQRVVINRYLSNQLLIFRSLVAVNINNVLPFLANDGLTEDWITVISTFVVPFIKQHKVLEVVHNFENSNTK